MQTSDPMCDADSGLSLKELGADIVSVVCQRMPTPGISQEHQALASCFEGGMMQ
jgi:hypothetical protein